MATLHPPAHSAHNANDVEMDDFEIDINVAGTPMMQDNLEVPEENFVDADLPDAQSYRNSAPTTPRSVAMDNDETGEMLDVSNMQHMEGNENMHEAPTFQVEDVDVDEQAEDHPSSLEEQENQESFNLENNAANLQYSQDGDPAFVDQLDSSTNHQQPVENLDLAPVEENPDDMTAVNINSETDLTSNVEDRPAGLHDEEFEAVNVASGTESQVAASSGAHAHQTEETSDARTEKTDLETTTHATPPLSEQAPVANDVESAHDERTNPEKSPETISLRDETGVKKSQDFSIGQNSETEQPIPKDSSENSEHLNVHPILVEWDDQKDWLFQPEADNEYQGYYLSDSSLAHQTYNELFRALRVVLEDAVSETEELQIKIPMFDTVICEDSCPTDSHLADLVNIYVKLEEHDGNSPPEHFEVTLLRRTRFNARFAQLKGAAASGQGTSQLDFLQSATNASSSQFVGEEEDEEGEESEESLVEDEAHDDQGVPVEDDEHGENVNKQSEENEQLQELEQDVTGSSHNEDLVQSTNEAFDALDQHETVEHEEGAGISVQQNNNEQNAHDENWQNVEYPDETEFMAHPGDETSNADQLGALYDKDEDVNEPSFNDFVTTTADNEADPFLGGSPDYENHTNFPNFGGDGLLDGEEYVDDSTFQVEAEEPKTDGVSHEQIPQFANSNEETSGDSADVNADINAGQLLTEDDLIDYDDEEIQREDEARASSTPTVQGDDPIAGMSANSRNNADVSPSTKRARDDFEDIVAHNPEPKKRKSG